MKDLPAFKPTIRNECSRKLPAPRRNGCCLIAHRKRLQKTKEEKIKFT